MLFEDTFLVMYLLCNLFFLINMYLIEHIKIYELNVGLKCLLIVEFHPKVDLGTSTWTSFELKSKFPPFLTFDDTIHALILLK